MKVGRGERVTTNEVSYGSGKTTESTTGFSSQPPVAEKKRPWVLTYFSYFSEEVGRMRHP